MQREATQKYANLDIFVLQGVHRVIFQRQM